MNEQEATERIDETIARYKTTKKLSLRKIGEHDRTFFQKSAYYSWIHLSELSLFQEEEGGPFYGSDGNTYELELE